ncbi:hypothetical protein [Pseudomonas sp. R5-89-07]|uniref:hypothetical protein n=1 Tax=Pseudomonas sp. R5-89-07 TaxID=658644 RepID=UPI000F56FB6B|nr:hypothetical protein [Pseudomonas sp. R5-89-07]AZF05603.1 putative lipoprotein [Pseudomonas sp. R5-89-07]
MRILIAAVVVAMLAGCATSPMSARDAKPVPSDELYAFQSKTQNATSRITVVRDGGFVGSGCDLVLYIEGRRAAKIGPGQRASFYVEPGPVNLGTGLAESGLCAGAAIRTISATLKPGGESQFRISGDMGGFFLAPYVDYGGR